ncbi:MULTISPECIES: hypothetical protein [Aeromicrobium]|uniref:hypothetical protein n=1 Tax=Aeromicrobium TaxID=2040 RepID=UPI00257C31DB|nr:MULTISPECIES: hypothetical protein [Aeromicrobium]
MEPDGEDDYVRGLGSIVVAAGRLEYEAYYTAYCLGVLHAPNLKVRNALAEARDLLVKEQQAPWCRLEIPDFDRWANSCREALEERNAVFHSYRTNWLLKPGAQPIRAHYWTKDGSEVDVSPSGLQNLFQRLDEVARKSLAFKLGVEVKPGVFEFPLDGPGFPPSSLFPMPAALRSLPGFDQSDQPVTFEHFGHLTADERKTWVEWAECRLAAFAARADTRRKRGAPAEASGLEMRGQHS